MNLTVINHSDQRVLTTQQLAEVYKTESKNIQMNFSNNRDRFVLGRDFNLLTGDDLKMFKESLPNDIGEPLKFAPMLYLWTKRGANRHCKILDTDEAWKQFDVLEETYFEVRQAQPMSQIQVLQQAIGVMAEQEKRLNEQQSVLLTHELALSSLDQKITNEITLTSKEQYQIQGAVKVRIARLGNGDYAGIYSALKKNFMVSSYKDIKKSDLSMAFQFINSWTPLNTMRSFNY